MSVKKVTVTWDDKLKFEGASQERAGYTLPLDGKKAAGGEEKGFSPMELLLLGLAGCTGMDVISILRKKRQDITAFAVNVSGARADDHPRIWQDIEIEYVVTGHDVDPAAVERSIELSSTKYCGAHAMLHRAAEIKSTYQIIDADTN